jgi:hypothetical protein
MKKYIVSILNTIWKDEKKSYNILLGGVFFLIPPLQLISLGFLSQKMENLISLDMKSPKWDQNWKLFFKKGVMLAVILIGYLFIPFLIMFLSGLFTTILSKGKIMSLFFFRGQVLSFLSDSLFIVALFFLPFAICEAVQENSWSIYLSKGFNIPKIMERILLVIQDYIKVFGIILLLYAVSIGIIFLVLNHIVGFLLSGFILFFDGLFSIHLISKVYPRKEIKMKTISE